MICICGESGSGKTTSIRNLNPEETFIITTTGKKTGYSWCKKRSYRNLNTAGKTPEELGNFYTTTSVDNVATMLKLINSKMAWIKYVIIDDFQYFMAFEAMDRAKEKGYEKFTEMAQHAYSSAEKCNESS